jgi:hypothetical protein
MKIRSKTDMKNAIFQFRVSTAAFALMSFGVLLVWLVVCPSAAQATSMSYRIDYTLLSSSTAYGPTLPGAPLPTIFTYDSSTDLFAGLTMIWPSSTGNIGFGFSAPCGFGGSSPWCGSSYDVNALNVSFRQNYFSDLLNGGTWFAATTLVHTIDSYVGLDGLSFIALSTGNDMGDSASGTFTTTLVPEPSSLVLLGAGLVSIVAVKFRKRRAQVSILRLSETAETSPKQPRRQG